MNDTNFEPRHTNMGRHIASGVFNSGYIQVIKVFSQFVSVIVLSRLLSPSEFGIVAMAGPVFGFVALFQDFSLSQATVQKSMLNQNEVSAFFWINVGLATILTIIIAAISPLAGWYYHEPRVVPITAAMGLLIFIGSFGNQHNAILTRRMEFGIQSIIGTIGTLSGLVTSIVLAIILKNYWALYLGMVVGTIIPVACVWFASRWRPSFPHLVPGMGEMLKFGAGITTSNVASFFAGNTDNILLGHRWGDQQLGFYDRAYKLLLFPMQRITGPVMGILVPVLSRLTREPDRYRRIFFRAVVQLSFATWPGIIWAIILADTLIPTLLDKQWVASAAIFQPLAIAGLLQVVNGSSGVLFVSQARTGEMARWSVFNAVTCVLAFVIGLPYGPIGVAIGYAISECLRTPLLWWYITRRGPIKAMALFRAILPQIGSSAVSALALLAYRKLQAPPIVFLLGGLIISYGVYGLILCLSSGGRETLEHTWDAGRRMAIHLKLIS